MIVRPDLPKHYVAGLLIGLLYVFVPLVYVVLFATLVFVGKEVYDVYKPVPTGFDFVDLAADYWGLIDSLLVVFVLKTLL